MIKSKIISHKEIAKNIYQLELLAPEVAGNSKAGQFVNVYLKDKSKLLPRPISICEIREDRLVLVYGVVGKGTEELSSYEPGESLSILGPLGNGFSLEGSQEQANEIGEETMKRVVLVGGGIGVPPMVQLAKELKGKAEEIIAVVGFKEEPFLIETLMAVCTEVYVATDSGKTGFQGNVVQLIETENIQGTYYFACGPKMMLKNLTQFCAQKAHEKGSIGIPIQISLEERMGCGYGACVGCTCKVKGKASPLAEDACMGFQDETHVLETVVLQKKVCTDGPVFLGKEVVWDA
ncbi:MAG: dihydroorotate dehydrogenase electron transfer subunit [Anaerovorax sp.]